MNKTTLSNFLRKLRLVYAADWLKFYLEKLRNIKINGEFKRKNPAVKLPPDYLMYESFLLNYNDYYYGGKSTAEWLVENLKQYSSLKDKRILDWGCGPGRIIRHLPDIIGNGAVYYATDYNKTSVEWCSANLPGVNFNNNSLAATLPYPDDFFDIIYGISIFTHLSEQLHFEWYAELYRVLNKGGVMFFTMQGDSFKVKLTEAEKNVFNGGGLVVRGNVKEGHRTYSAFHPKEFIHKLFKDVQILAHIETATDHSSNLSQDVWIVGKARQQVNKKIIP